MPALFSLTRHAALSEATARLHDGEAISQSWTTFISCQHQSAPLHCSGEELAGLTRFQPIGAEPVWTRAPGRCRRAGALEARPPCSSSCAVSVGARTNCSARRRGPSVCVASFAFLCLPTGKLLVWDAPARAIEALAREHEDAVHATLLWQAGPLAAAAIASAFTAPRTAPIAV